MRPHAWTIALVFATALPARAQDDPDTEIARRHFRQGAAFYEQRDYLHAVDEFQAALRVRESPPIHYNIARCYDRLERFADAVREYRLFAERAPEDPDAPEVKRRIAVLEERLARAPAPATPTTPATPATATLATPPPPVLVPPAPPRGEALLPLATVPAVDEQAERERERERSRRRLGLAVGLPLAALAVAGGAVGLYFALQPSPPPPLTMSDFPPIEATP